MYNMRLVLAVVVSLFGASVAGAGAGSSDGASGLPAPEGPVILTVSGGIGIGNGNANDAGVATFDRVMLENLDWREIETHTSFTTGPQRFAGPTLASLLDAVAAEGETMIATAINGYFVEIPVAHAAEHDVLLALDMNGRPMRVRDKGPIWVVYPLSEQEILEKPFDTEMIWQLSRIEVQS